MCAGVSCVCVFMHILCMQVCVPCACVQAHPMCAGTYCICVCVQAASEPFLEKGREPEGELRMLINTPALLAGKPLGTSWSL